MPTPSGYADVSMQLKLLGFQRPAYVTFGVDPAGSSADAVAAAVMTAATATNSFMSQMDASVTLAQVRASLGTDSGEDVVGLVSGTSVGLRIKTTLPPNCAMLVRKTTSRGGRRGRGRFYIPWIIEETEIDEAGTVQSAAVALVQTAMNNFLTALTTGTIPMVVLHNPSTPGTVHPSTPGAPNLVTALVVDSLVATQRRRLGR